LIKSILKKHRLSKYYNNIQQIYCEIMGVDPIIVPRETEEKIINMFQEMQDSFKKNCPPNRKSFLSYSYVLNKLFKMLDLEEYAKYFKIPERKEEQDKIFQKICKDMGWKFI
ncbi:MAG: hypothetical protein KZQ69_17495, partial [gamma proteobacterium symbiont of Bathyaustriella thionipta]|nr:hypothetical protein [gamma proteobacterium symbiont of Bathyaustriella thionipta]